MSQSWELMAAVWALHELKHVYDEDHIRKHWQAVAKLSRPDLSREGQGQRLCLSCQCGWTEMMYRGGCRWRHAPGEGDGWQCEEVCVRRVRAGVVAKQELDLQHKAQQVRPRLVKVSHHQVVSSAPDPVERCAVPAAKQQTMTLVTKAPMNLTAVCLAIRVAA